MKLEIVLEINIPKKAVFRLGFVSELWMFHKAKKRLYLEKCSCHAATWFCFCYYCVVCVCMHEQRYAWATMCLWQSEDNFRESVPSLYCEFLGLESGNQASSSAFTHWTILLILHYTHTHTYSFFSRPWELKKSLYS